ncbi:NAD(P)-binding protein [Aspergillus japonicus CBS 114.51]|uniref:NAD(P)-binding protein n=1 Tax=Aspergillus japonicus CBS 114.51 TaxID=1448312 RepID=A0A8T8XG23_ASPJA|nr:NAD(P)-binding protein [Aspergillus japonicus CBS 114.51]RAH87216.1 NAD(P)-binding protein [Aspergillus japonicus CBS 114.51]
MLAETHSVIKTDHHVPRTPGPGATTTNLLDNTPKLRAACENCRQSKVKCNLSVSGGKEASSASSSSSSACIRCLRHGLTCRYRVANRSGKPKGSKNRATLRKLGQLQLQQQQQQQQNQHQHAEQRKPMISRGGGGGNLHGGWNYIEPFVSSQPPSVVDGILEEPSPEDTSQPSHSNSPDSQGVSMTDVSSLLDESCAAAAQHLGYPRPPHPSCMGGPPSGGYVPPPPPPPLPPPPLSIFDQPTTTTTTTTTTATSSMSPTFLQKEFITKGITSCPLAVHMQPTCDCGDALVFHMNRLRSVTTMVHLHPPRLDLLLQAIATALATCRLFLQCPGCPKDGTHLLYAASIVDFTVQLFDFAIPYELSLTATTTAAAAAVPTPASTTTSTSPTNDPGVLVGYGEYEIAVDETRRIRRYLLRGRLLQCRAVVGLLQETTEVSRQELFVRSSSSPGAGAGAADLTAAFENGDLILQILAGHDATVEAFLLALAGEGCGLLAHQTALITGAAQGIGAETARLFAREGARVVIADVDGEKSHALALALNTQHGANTALAIPGDLTDETYLTTLIQQTAAFGNGKIHILVNNAGFTWDGVIHKMTTHQFTTMLAIHATAPFQLVRAAAPFFRVKDGDARCIVNISSTSGVHGNAGQANYSTAKAAITGLTKTIAKEWGPGFGVRANTVAFGHVRTRLTAPKEDGAVMVTAAGERVALGIPGAQLAARRGGASDEEGKEDGNGHGDGNGKGPGGQYPDIPLGRPASAEEAARVVLAVASPLFAYVTGETIRVTGGRNM